MPPPPEITSPAGLTELDWRAFLYVSGELSSAEAESFERLLEDDQPTREAVARAVELIHRLAAAPVVAAAPPAPASIRPAVLAALTTIAALIVVCLSFVSTGDRAAPERGHSAATTPAGAVVALWTASDDADEDLDNPADDPAGDADLAIPVWMFSAVGADTGG